MRQLTRRQGFTLIELLVVIAVIALLLSIVLPALKKAKERTRELVCTSNLRQVGLSILLYLDQNENKTYEYDNSQWDEGNGFFWTDGAGNDLAPDDEDSYWGVAYGDYAQNLAVFGCPSFQRVSELIYPVDPELIRHAAFGLNNNFVGLNTRDIRSPARFIVASDHVEPRVEQGSKDMFHNDGPGTLNLTAYRKGGFREEFYRGIFRHNIRSADPFETGGRANMLWLDGHVSNLEETTGDDVPKRWYTGE